MGFAIICLPFVYPAFCEADYLFVQEPFVIAASEGNVAQVDRLLRLHADPEGATDNGELALLSAAESGHIEVVKLLIAHGADVNAKDSNGWSATAVAEENGYDDIVQMLKKAGAHP